ncbi:porin [Paraburkholderia sp. Ac-20336]|uniref:porin n=1 Tax=Burkholderiaceae TaxID=119060 RepID=UPI0014238CD3|nr:MULTISPECIES: porin [Burkholderiaceae]MBN3805467.1 porin [Paraburkholderia sp. Ac-20336]MBN3851581.1 porin [Paraburkholderia sp. Ac-20342]NIF52798.1 porin [Burkholderia sp. Ax-1724]NIF78737.1 porin [Paraburkholderia sp. Cy-641]
MKKAWMLIALLAASDYASAQSSVTLFGQIDEAIAYINNAGGGASVRMRSGTWVGSQWGLTGNEDLGGGYRAFFRLENGFDLNTGKLGQNGRQFGRQSYLGLGTPYGNLTFGRQYDMVVDYVGPIMANGRGSAPAYDIDNTGNDWQTSNSVKYTTPTFHGFSAGALYAFGGVPGQFSTNSVVSAGAGYTGGPLQVGAAYTSVRNPYATWFDSTGASNILIFGAYLPNARALNIAAGGVSYKFGNLIGRVGMSHSDLTQSINGADAQFNIYMAQADYWMRSDIRLGAAVDLVYGNIGSLGQHPRYQQYNLVADYYLSKRTDLYMWAIYGTAGGDATRMQIGQLPASTTNKQFNINFGIRHRF